MTGLTTGAITGVVDRLEKAGLVRRERDESDRRKVYIAIVPENVAKVGKYYEHLQRAMLKQWDGFSDAELKLLLRFMTQGYTTMLGAIEELKAMMEPAKEKGRGRPSTKPAKAP
jgi:DNA-binding MarR family transcriptional regulator